jgi:hypothetical protein
MHRVTHALPCLASFGKNIAAPGHAWGRTEGKTISLRSISSGSREGTAVLEPIKFTAFQPRAIATSGA